ncbi:MAG: hypothetical protein CMJ76_10720 [Planctomycetaceae bacterium]|nr:hypothetical protein [Planctomycetaceae bacterium]
MDSLKSIAQSFYKFFKTGRFESAIDDISMLTMEQSYECQRIYHSLREADGDKPFGYKVGCTSAAIRKQFGFAEPIYGRLLTPGLINERTPLKADQFYSLAIEPEFVIVLKRELTTKNPSDDELRDAIAEVRPGIELHNYVYHYPQPTRQELICSNGIHAGQIIGTNVSTARDVHWEMEGVAVFRNGKLVASGVAADIMEGPLNSLRFLISHLNAQGETLKAGEMVIPGSATALIPVGRGDEITCRFTHIGEVTAKFE